MERMIAGYRRFKEEVFPEQKHRFRMLSESQNPHTLFITCADSRVVPNLFTQCDPGELFFCRVVGNLVPAYGADSGGVASAIEYAVVVLGVKHVVVCGHSDCGAMRAFLHPEKLGHLRAVQSWLQHAHAAISVAQNEHRHLPDEAFIKALIQENVVVQMNNLKTHPSVAAALRKGTLEVHGWVYDIGHGEILAYDENFGGFSELGEARKRAGEANGMTIPYAPIPAGMELVQSSASGD